MTEPPFHRWGRVAEPINSRGAYLFFEEEPSDGWKQPQPPDAMRVWCRMPGTREDDDRNWTLWLHRPALPEWIAHYAIEEWLPEGVEPSWESA